MAVVEGDEQIGGAVVEGDRVSRWGEQTARVMIVSLGESGGWYGGGWELGG